MVKELGETRRCSFSPIGFALGGPLAATADTDSGVLAAEAQKQVQELYSAVSSFA